MEGVEAGGYCVDSVGGGVRGVGDREEGEDRKGGKGGGGWGREGYP